MFIPVTTRSSTIEMQCVTGESKPDTAESGFIQRPAVTYLKQYSIHCCYELRFLFLSRRKEFMGTLNEVFIEPVYK